MPLLLVRMVSTDDEHETVEAWEAAAATEAEAIREVQALSPGRGQRIEAKLVSAEDTGTVAPGQPVRLE
jgi:hypothetical protein